MSSEYTHGREILPHAALMRCQGALDGAYKIVTFRSGGPLTHSELSLGPALAMECRARIGEAGYWERVRSINVYIPGQHRGGRPSKQLDADVRYLVGLGHGTRAIADALFIPETTVQSCISRLRLAPGRNAPSVATPEVVRLGMKALHRRYAGPWVTAQDLAATLGLAESAERLEQRIIEAGFASMAMSRRVGG